MSDNAGVKWFVTLFIVFLFIHCFPVLFWTTVALMVLALILIV